MERGYLDLVLVQSATETSQLAIAVELLQKARAELVRLWGENPLEVLNCLKLCATRNGDNEPIVLMVDGREGNTTPKNQREKACAAVALLDQLSLHCMHNRFETVVSPELLIDAVDVITQSLRAYTNILGDFGGTASSRKHLQDLNFL